MMPLIRFTRPSGAPVWIAPEAVIMLTEASTQMDNSRAKTVIHLESGGEQTVRESPDGVLAALRSPGP